MTCFIKLQHVVLPRGNVQDIQPQCAKTFKCRKQHSVNVVMKYQSSWKFLIFNVDHNVPSDMSAHLSKISNTLSFIFPGLPDDSLEKNIIQLKTDMLSLPELHLQVWAEIHSCFHRLQFALCVHLLFI